MGRLRTWTRQPLDQHDVVVYKLKIVLFNPLFSTTLTYILDPYKSFEKRKHKIEKMHTVAIKKVHQYRKTVQNFEKLHGIQKSSSIS